MKTPWRLSCLAPSAGARRIDGRRSLAVRPAALVALVCFAWASGGRSESVQEDRGLAPVVEREVERELVAFEGFVLEPGGAPAAGAVVVSSAGGRAVTDGDGRYHLEVGVPIDAWCVQFTAVGAAGTSRFASTSVALPATARQIHVGPLQLALGVTCAPSWLPTFGGEPGVGGPVIGQVRALAVYDDGSGPALYVGGEFRGAGGTDAKGIARWDGSGWKTLGDGIPGGFFVYALAVYDDGSGPALYVGGNFLTIGGVAANRIAKWDGSSWSRLGSGVWTAGAASSSVLALTVYDDGSGPALYAGGPFTVAGGVSALHVAKWDGSAWSALGGGVTGALDPEVRALTVFDDGSGPALFAGGKFTSAGGVAASRIAKWNGSSWSALSSGANSLVNALAVYDDGSGTALYAAGEFSSPATYIAKWNGSSWAAVGSGLETRAYSLVVYDDGDGPALYSGGGDAGTGVGVARWDGASWTALGSGTNGLCYALAVFDDGDGAQLYDGGTISIAGGVGVNSIATWDGSSWAALETRTGWLNDDVLALAVFDDGNGPALYAGGLFRYASGALAEGLAKWDGASWSALDARYARDVRALVVFDDGVGPALYAGNLYANGLREVAKWDGSAWSALGGGFSGWLYPEVRALTVYDDGGGEALYAGGLFLAAGGVPANYIAKWDGSSWSALGGGMSYAVNSMAVLDDGGGPALYAGGQFTNAGGVAASNIAKWDGSSWSALGTGLAGRVLSMTTHDDGSGPALYVGGEFLAAGGVAANRIAKWDGSSWSSLGTGLGGLVYSMTTHDDGSGPALYVGGDFLAAGGVAANRIAKWDGSSWSALGSGTNWIVTAFATLDDANWPALYVGGRFNSAPDSGDSYVAKWGCLDLAPVLSCPPAVHVIEPFGPPGEFVTFTVTAVDDHDPSPVVVCMPPSGSFFPRGTTLVSCTATDASGNQSICEFPVSVQIKARLR